MRRLTEPVSTLRVPSGTFGILGRPSALLGVAVRVVLVEVREREISELCWASISPTPRSSSELCVSPIVIASFLFESVYVIQI